MPSRRQFCQAIGASVVAAGSVWGSDRAATALSDLPPVGMGTWITFDVREDVAARARRLDVWDTFFQLGGALVDSSPMYGSSPDVIGHCINQDRRRGRSHQLFSASKVWTLGQYRGQQQMEMSRSRWGIDRFDLMQIHNMLDWEVHWQTLRDWRRDGRVRFVGITTSHGRRHRDMLAVIEKEPFDCVQFSYNIADRQAEDRLLPAAAESGKAVIVNRPFATGGLFRRVAGVGLPPIAQALKCESWAAFFLKFVISHPAVTLAIPATSNPQHMEENMAALRGPVPDRSARRDMIKAFQGLT